LAAYVGQVVSRALSSFGGTLQRPAESNQLACRIACAFAWALVSVPVPFAPGKFPEADLKSSSPCALAGVVLAGVVPDERAIPAWLAGMPGGAAAARCAAGDVAGSLPPALAGETARRGGSFASAIAFAVFVLST
jgi:hypothetical protein